MKKKILTLMLALTSVVGYAQAQKTPPEDYDPNKVVVFSFVAGNDIFMLGLNDNNQRLKETMSFIDANKEHINDGSMPIFVYGYCGKGGTETTRATRVKLMSNYVKGELIRIRKAKESNFVTSNSLNCYSDILANAVVLKFYLPFDYEIRKPKFSEKPNLISELKGADDNQKEPAVTQVRDSLKTVVAAQQPAHQVVANEKVEQAIAKQSAVEPLTPESTPMKTQSAHHLRWYAGIELGLPVGISTFTAFDSKGRAGFEGSVLGGYRISPLLSAEFGATFGTMKLGASKCCSDYFLGADGMRYLEHVAGMESYSYKDVYSSVFVQQYALRLNVDLLQIGNPDWQKRWSLTVSPAIYGIGTKATLKTDNTTIIKRDGRFQFGAGVGIGGSYQITENLGIGLRTGMVWAFGERFDGIVPTDHKENMIWNNTLTLTWRFGCNK